MRGAQLRHDLRPPSRRIIPAYAGSTIREGPWAWDTRDHPRVCGEHLLAMFDTQLPTGSSPRMRGAHAVFQQGHPARGIIPAYAGSTRGSSTVATWSRDHPRVCGEHGGAHVARGKLQGSSPRMRGALDVQRTTAVAIRIIPAYAGSTRRMPRRPPWRRDHPRVCGEHRWRCKRCGAVSGSSPRMRGARLAHGAAVAVHGIIPAYAGSTHACDCDRPTGQDHPRVCGEHEVGIRRALPSWGSSPRMRGAPPLLWG